MEKLIELLNEYASEDFNWCAIGGKIYDKEYSENDIPVNVEMGVYVISKQFGFIKWLVDNDKIEFREDFYLEDQHGGGFGEDENIIMLLSIQDDAIGFLISLLK